jgi:PIN domain nuclease of toxin-antitoxin system
VIVHVLDAHALVWMLEGNARLGLAAQSVLGDPNSSLLLPAIALAEACWVVQKGNTSLLDWRDVIKVVRADSRIQVVSLDAAIIERAMTLPTHLEMHDAQIVATALITRDGGADVRLLTRDRMIVASGLIAIVW